MARSFAYDPEFLGHALRENEDQRGIPAYIRVVKLGRQAAGHNQQQLPVGVLL